MKFLKAAFDQVISFLKRLNTIYSSLRICNIEVFFTKNLCKNTVVKGICNEQETKIKRLATRLLRMASSGSVEAEPKSVPTNLRRLETAKVKRADRLEFLVERIDDLTAK